MKKVFLLQLDGLSGPALDRALRENLMPFTKSLTEHGWVKREFFCGIPSTTPASQMSLLYGLNDMVAGFRFLMKSEKKIFSPTILSSVVAMESSALYRNPKALLRDGSTAFTIFTGGSKQSISFSGVASDKRVVSKLFPLFTQPLRFIAFVIKILIFLIIERKEYLSDKRGQFFTGFHRIKHVLKRLVEEITVGELALYLSKKMIADNEPVIYVDFTGYDEIAHSYGPTSRFAKYYLSVLDLYVKACADMIVKKNTSHELIIVSDHGQVDSMPYPTLTGKTIDESIALLYPHRKIFHGETDVPYEQLDTSDLLIMSSGGLGLVYDIHGTQRQEIPEFEATYPDFFEKVSQLPGIQCVIGREAKNVVVFRRGKRVDLSLKTMHEVFPLLPVNIHQNVYEHLCSLLMTQYSADAYILGEITSDYCVGFELQLGSHGGVGGDQTTAFSLSKNFAFDGHVIKDYADIYHALHAFIYETEVKI